MLCQDKFLQVVEEYIRPLTYPVAVKLVKEEEDFPHKTRFPRDVTGSRGALCQGIAMARRVGWKVGYRREDHSCVVSLMMFGFEEEPEAVKNGDIVYPYYASTEEAGKKTQDMTPRLPLNSIKGIVAAPLSRADFAADVVLVYGNAAQIIRLVQGSLYHNGGTVDSSFSGRAACGSEIIVPFQTQDCKVIIPCGGERVFAHTADDEVVFAIPASKLDEVSAGIEATHKSGIARIPTPFLGMTSEPVYPKKYYDVAKSFGIDDK